MGSYGSIDPTTSLSTRLGDFLAALGEDNEYVYKEILGFSDDEVADLLVEGVITTEMDRPPGF